MYTLNNFFVKLFYFFFFIVILVKFIRNLQGIKRIIFFVNVTKNTNFLTFIIILNIKQFIINKQDILY